MQQTAMTNGPGGEAVAIVLARIDGIATTLGHRAPGELARAVEAIRREAIALGLHPALPVIHAIEAALARGEHGAGLNDWMLLLRDAIGCGRADAEAEQLFAAACSVRAIRGRS